MHIHSAFSAVRAVVRLVAVSVLLTAFCVVGARAQVDPGGKAPVAKKVHTERAINGSVLVDDYGWMRERTSPEVVSHLEAENAYAEKVLAPLKPLQEKLYGEMLSHIQQTDDSVPFLLRGYWYYTRTIEGKQYFIQCRRKGSMTAPEEVMLDLNAMAVGEKFMSVRYATVSDDNTMLAYATDTVGFRQYKMHVKDLRTGKVLPDTAERVTSLEWAADGKTLFYTTEDAVTKRSNLTFRHVVGGEAGKDALIYEDKDERFNVAIKRTRDGKYLLLSSGSRVTDEWQYLRADTPTGAWTMIEPRKANVEYGVDEGADVFYLRINDKGQSFRVVTAPVAAPGKAHWKELIATRADVPLEDLEIFKDFYVLTERVRGLPVLRVVSLKDGATKKIEFPEAAYMASAATNAEFATTKFRYRYQSPVTPNSTFEYDVKAGTSVLLKETKVPGGFERANYAMERLWAVMRDGTKVPVSVVYRKDKFRRGANPLYVYAYGSYGITTGDGFIASQLALLDRGVVAAVAHIRGGGELGEPWHDAGKMMTKMNTFTDFIDSTEYLLKEGYGAKGRVGIEGGSAGGLLMGAVTNMRTDLFKAVLCEVPFVDVMNTMLDASLPLTVPEYEEWGNPNEKAAFDYMLKYSPYDNVKAQAYPNILVRTSFDDSQVMYWEPAKYVAKLRAMKTDKNDLVFLVNMHGGHGGSSGRYDSLKDTAMNYAFLLHELGAE